MKDGLVVAVAKFPLDGPERFSRREFTDFPIVVKYVTVYNKSML